MKTSIYRAGGNGKGRRADLDWAKSSRTVFRETASPPPSASRALESQLTIYKIIFKRD